MADHDAPGPAVPPPAKATFETARYLVCPACGNRMSSIDHIGIGRTFGPWQCGHVGCGATVSGTVTEDGADITIGRVENEPQFALLKFRDVYFVMLDKYGGKEDSADYFYHSHQCPTNLLGSVEHVFDAEGSDPHGMMRFVAQVPWSKDSAENLEHMGSLAELFAFFRTDGQPATTKWPEENAGVLPFIVEARRDDTKKRSPKA